MDFLHSMKNELLSSTLTISKKSVKLRTYKESQSFNYYN